MIRQAVFHMHFVSAAKTLAADDFNFPYSLPMNEENEELSIEEQEQKTIAKAIQMSGGNLSKAARLLKIGRTTLYRKLNQYPHLKKLRHQSSS